MDHKSLYIVDNANEDQSVKKYLSEWCPISKQMDIAKLVMDLHRIPYPKTKKSFLELVALGKSLCKCHLMEESERVDTNFNCLDKNLVEKYKYQSGKVVINEKQSFNNILERDWSYSIGGYQPLQKWLKDRKGMSLTKDDIIHYERIIHCIRETQILTARIDDLMWLD